MTRIPGSIKDRYEKAVAFGKPTVLRAAGPSAAVLEEPWWVVGPRHRWLGCTFKTFQEALNHAQGGH